MLPLLLLSTAAWAHRPHAVVSALAAAPDFEDSGRAWLVYNPSDNAQLMRTDDWGAHWDQVGGPPQADAMIGLAYFDTTLVVIAEDGTVWASDDEGRTWGEFDLASGAPRSVAATAGRIAVATDDGVWAGASMSAAEWVAALPGEAIDEVAWSSTGEAVVLARHDDGTISRSSDGGSSFLPLEPLPDGHEATAIAEIDGVSFGGTSAGVYQLGGEGWSACGALPATDTSERGTYVTHLQADRAALYATTASEAFFVSLDGCATWTLIDAGLSATFGGIGGVTDMDSTYVAVVLRGEHAIVAGFDGVVSSSDGGDTWRDVEIVASDYVRGLVVSPAFPLDPRILFGTYGGGAVWTVDGGESFSGSNLGMAGPYNFGLVADPDFPTNNRAFWAGGEPDSPARTLDGGATWELLDAGLDHAVGGCEAGGRVYLFGSFASGGHVVRTEDGGDTWEEVTGLYDVLQGVYPSLVREQIRGGAPRLLATADRPAMLLASDDDGGTWTILSTWDEDERSTGLQIWHNQRILHATYATGFHVSDDHGETWSDLDVPVEHPRTLAQADDGTLFTVDGGGQVYRSRDGGDSWDAVGERFAPTVSMIIPAAEFASFGYVFVGTSQGVYWSDSHGDSWHPFPRFQRFAMQGFHLTCEGLCTSWDDGSGGLDDAWELDELATVSFSFRGHALRMAWDTVVGAPNWVVEVDGVTATTDTSAEWLVDGLDEGWHDVTLRVAGGTARLFAVEALGDGETFPFDGGEDTGDTGDTAAEIETGGETGGDSAPVDSADSAEDTAVDTPRTEQPPPTDPCGCGSGGGAAITAPLVLLAAGRRRRREDSGRS